MEVGSILETVSRVRREIRERRSQRAGSRSISPYGLGSSRKNTEEKETNFENSIRKEPIPENCSELIEKYSVWRCPLPKSKSKSKTYKLDAVELLMIVLKKPIQRLFSSMKQTGNKKISSKKPPICRSARTRPESQGSFNDFFLDSFQRSPKPPNSFYFPLITLATSLSLRVQSLEFHFVAILKMLFKNHKCFLPVWSVLRKRMRVVVRLVKGDQGFGSLIATPKFLLTLTPSNPSTARLAQRRSSTTLYTPGTIIRTNLFSEKSAPNSSEEPERNPTFGPDSEDSLSLETLKLQNSLRSQQIKQSLKELELSNHKSQLELNRSNRLSIGSSRASLLPSDSFISLEYKNESFVSQSAKKFGFKGLISPIRVQHRHNGSEGLIEVISNEEEMSLKSFQQYTHGSSFEKESYLVRNTSRDELESFDIKISRYVSSSPKKTEKRHQNKQKMNPAAMRRKKLLERLQGLSKLEDTFFARFHLLFLEVVRAFEMFLKGLVAEKFQNKMIWVLKRVVKEVVNAKTKEDYVRGIKGMAYCLNCGFLQCKEKVWKKWQMKVRLQMIKKKERFAGICSLVEVLKKNTFVKKYFVMSLLKSVRKRGKQRKIGLSQARKGSSLLLRILNTKKKSIFTFIFQVYKTKKILKSFSQTLLKSSWDTWKSSPLKTPQECLLSLIEICKKKHFPVLWSAWKSLKNLNKLTLKLKQKILLKKSIEAWISFTSHQSNRWIEVFYHWKRINTQEKLQKLKSYKKIFL